MAVPAAIAKAAAMLLTNEKTRKGVGWILVAVFSPVILLIALLCAIGSGGSEHNNYSVEACFYPWYRISFHHHGAGCKPPRNKF